MKSNLENPHHQAAVTFKGPQDREYVLRFSIDAICHLEAATGRTFPAIAVDMGRPDKVSMTLLRHLMHAGLLEHHPEMTLKDAGELIVAGAGGLQGSMALVEHAIASAFPSAEASGTLRPPAAPPNRAARRRAGAG